MNIFDNLDYYISESLSGAMSDEKLNQYTTSIVQDTTNNTMNNSFNKIDKQVSIII